MKIFKRQTFNDSLALLIIPGVPGLWLLSHWYPLPEMGLGASIAMWTMVITHYFRKKAPDGVSSSHGAGAHSH